MARSPAIACVALVLIWQTPAVASDWTVWKQFQTAPAQVAVAPSASLGGPWQVDSMWRNDLAGALKKACWLVRNGDITGRRYVWQQMMSGQVNCDVNCNCR